MIKLVIFFDAKNANEKHLLYNEIFLPVIEKQKILEAYKLSTYQLLEYLTEQKRNQSRTVAHQNHAQTYFQKHLFHFI